MPRKATAPPPAVGSGISVANGVANPAGGVVAGNSVPNVDRGRRPRRHRAPGHGRRTPRRDGSPGNGPATRHGEEHLAAGAVHPGTPPPVAPGESRDDGAKNDPPRGSLGPTLPKPRTRWRTPERNGRRRTRCTGGAWIPSPWSMLRASHGGARPRPETLRAPMAGPSTRAGRDDLV
uniref:Uncharacterized protein n=1 Tax=Pseudo-nitzschia australis TaxID=44445 RepID=A0A7S4AUU2_9STRA|mmetsp:Transcript_272/g.519  ORF Transcript_272/g.519 Transcript_272/m.519 type:complete len:177 (+) Transcript_272:253-783(+)